VRELPELGAARETVCKHGRTFAALAHRGEQFVDALGEVTGQLSRAERQALDSIPPGPPTCESAGSNPAASF